MLLIELFISLYKLKNIHQKHLLKDYRCKFNPIQDGWKGGSCDVINFEINFISNQAKQLTGVYFLFHFGYFHPA